MAPQQLALIDPPPFDPKWPKVNTREARALEVFLRGEAMTTPEFEARSFSWRLSAVVYRLRAWGWPIEAEPIASPTYDTPHRAIARYWLPEEYIRQALELLEGTA